MVKRGALRSLAHMTEALRATLERELKLTAESSFELPSFDGEPLATRTFTSMYHDTSDGRLIEAGITMRRRVENRRSAWQLKLPSSEGRIELETPGAKPGEKLLSLCRRHARACARRGGEAPDSAQRLALPRRWEHRRRHARPRGGSGRRSNGTSLRRGVDRARRRQRRRSRDSRRPAARDGGTEARRTTEDRARAPGRTTDPCPG